MILFFWLLTAQHNNKKKEQNETQAKTKRNKTKQHTPTGILAEMTVLTNSIIQEYEVRIIKGRADDNSPEKGQFLNKYEIVCKHKIEALNKLYSFCIGASILNQYDLPLRNNIMFTLCDTMNEIRKFIGILVKNRDFLTYKLIGKKLEQAVWKIFKDIIKQASFVNNAHTILSTRNKIFEQPEILSKMQEEEHMTQTFVTGLEVSDKSGLNVFEYCFAFEDESKGNNGEESVSHEASASGNGNGNGNRNNVDISQLNRYHKNQCEVFAELLNIYLGAIDGNNNNDNNILKNLIYLLFLLFV